MAALMAPSLESLTETRQRVLGTRNGTVKNRILKLAQAPTGPDPGDCCSELLYSTPTTHLSSYLEDADGMEESDDDEVFLACYRRTNERQPPELLANRSPAPSCSRASDPPVTPGAHGPVRLSPTERRPRVTFQRQSRSSELPLMSQGSLSRADATLPGPNRPTSATEATRQQESGTLESHRRRLLGAKQGTISERSLGERLPPFQPPARCTEVGGYGAPTKDDDDQEWEDDDNDDDDDGDDIARMNQEAFVTGRMAVRPATAGDRTKTGPGPDRSSYSRASTFQGRDEQPPVVAYLRSQTTASFRNRGTQQMPAHGVPRAAESPMGRPRSPACGSDNPQPARSGICARVVRQGERADSPNLMRRLADTQGDTHRVSASAGASPQQWARQPRAAFTRGGASGAGGLSPENRPMVQKSATQRPQIWNRSVDAVVSLPRSSSINASMGGAVKNDSRLRSTSPKSMSAQYGSPASRLVEELRAVRSMSPGGNVLRSTTPGAFVMNCKERLGNGESPPQGRTRYSRLMAQAAAAARGKVDA